MKCVHLNETQRCPNDSAHQHQENKRCLPAPAPCYERRTSSSGSLADGGRATTGSLARWPLNVHGQPVGVS
jgi:hypothetical protein